MTFALNKKSTLAKIKLRLKTNNNSTHQWLASSFRRGLRVMPRNRGARVQKEEQSFRGGEAKAPSHYIALLKTILEYKSATFSLFTVYSCTLLPKVQAVLSRTYLTKNIKKFNWPKKIRQQLRFRKVKHVSN